MNVLPIMTWPGDAKQLRIGQSDAVPIINDGVRALIDDMIFTMYAGDGVGLAAPQIGSRLSIIVVDPTGGKRSDTLRVFVNPHVIDRFGPLVTEEEGCLSIPGRMVAVTRSQGVSILAQDREGLPITYTAEGFEARIIQHEMDHLHSILILDHLQSIEAHDEEEAGSSAVVT